MIRRLSVLVVLLTVLTGTAWASQSVMDAQSATLDLEELENAGAEWMPDADLSAGWTWTAASIRSWTPAARSWGA